MTKSSLLLAALVASFMLVAGPTQGQTTPQSPAPAPAPTHGVHTISVTFDYDFRLTPACTSQVTKHCVQQFVVYDISGGASPTKRYKLFVVPVPPKASGAMHGIPGKSPPLNFESGKHLLGVTAQKPLTEPNNESDPQACTTWVTVP